MQKNQSSSISSVQVNVDDSGKCSTIDQACPRNNSGFLRPNYHCQDTATDLEANMKQSEDTDSSSPGSSSTQLQRPIRRKRRVRDKVKICRVCGDTAISHNFGAIVCVTCKAFFRRNAHKQKKLQPCVFNNNCTITKITRRFCSMCRLNKCFSIGMDPLLVLDDNEKSIRQARRERKKQFRGQQSQVASDDKPVSSEKPTTASSEHFDKKNTGLVLDQSIQASKPSSHSSSCVSDLIAQALTSVTVDSNKQLRKTAYGDSRHIEDVKYDYLYPVSGSCIGRMERQAGFSCQDSGSSSNISDTKVPCVSSRVGLIKRESLMNVQGTQSAAQIMTHQSQKTSLDIDFLTQAAHISCDSDEGFAQPGESTVSQRNQTCAESSSHSSAGDTCTQSNLHVKTAFSLSSANKAAIPNKFVTVDEATFDLSDHCPSSPPSAISNSDLFDTEIFPDFLISMICPPTPSHSIINHEQPDSVISPRDSEPNVNHGVSKAEDRSGCVCFSQESPSKLCDPKDWSQFSGLEKYCRGKNFMCESRNELPQDASLYLSLDAEERDTLTKLTTAYQEIPLKARLDKSARNAEIPSVLDLSFRNCVSFAKTVPGFRQLRKEDQIATIKASVVQTHCIRAAKTFDPQKRQWSTKMGNISVEDLARHYMGFYKGNNTCIAKVASYSEALHCVVENDDTLFALLHCIVLFDPHYPQVVDRKLLSSMKDCYLLLLKHYLESKFSFLHADTYMLEFMASLMDLRELGNRLTAHYKLCALKQPLVAEILTD